MSLTSNESLLTEIRKTSKCDLHLHLGGSWPLSFLRSIGPVEEVEKLARQLGEVASLSYHEVFGVFTGVSKLVDTESKVREGVRALAEELRVDGVTYAEVRTGLKDLGRGHRGYLKAVIEGLEGAEERVKLLLSLRRSDTAEFAEMTVDVALECRSQVVGIDVSGNATEGDVSRLFPALARARQEGLSLALHLGETLEELPAAQMLELTELAPDRIGHGVYLCPEARELVLQRGIPVELCPTSTKLWIGGSMEPVVEMVRAGHPISVATDDPLILGTTLSQEWLLVMQIHGFSLDDMKKIQERAWSHCFV